MTAPDRQHPTAVEQVARALGRLMMVHGDEDGDVFEWTACHDCRNQPGPCPCSGQPGTSHAFATAVLAYLRDSLAGPDPDAVAEALGLTVERVAGVYPSRQVVGPRVALTSDQAIDELRRKLS